MTALAVPAAFIRRDFLINRSYRIGFLLGIGGAIANTIVFFFLSSAIGVVGGPVAQTYGTDYFGFAIVGIAFTQLVAVGVGTMGGAVRDGQVTGTLELMLIGPTRPIAVLLSSGLFAHLSAFVSIAVYLLIGVALGLDLSKADWPATILGVALLIVACNAIGLVGAAVVVLIKQGNPVNWLITGASFVLGGVLYPTTVLPPVLESIANLLPLTPALQIVRRAMLGGASVGDLLPLFASLVVLTAIYVPIGLAAAAWAIRRARIDGSLAEF